MKIKFPLCLTLSALLLTGCTSFRAKFKNKQVANIGHFADATITMLSNLDLQITEKDTLLVRRFVDMSAPEEAHVSELNTRLKESLSNIVRYSIEIVNIAESDHKAPQKIVAFADYLETFREGITENDAVDFDLFESTISDIREQERFIEALRKAQPLLNVAVMAAALEIDDLINAIDTLSLKIDSRIDEEYADIIRYRTKLEREKFDILSAFEMIYDAYRMDAPELSKLRETGVIWTPEIIPAGRPTREDLSKIGEHLGSRMEALQQVQEEMKPNWDDYLATHRELDSIVDNTIEDAQHARIIMLTWVRAHQKMSAGVISEADWFDIGETTKQLIKSAPSAIL